MQSQLNTLNVGTAAQHHSGLNNYLEDGIGINKNAGINQQQIG